MQKWGSERPLGADYSKDAANNNQLDAALTSGDENGLTQPHRHRKGETNIKMCTDTDNLTTYSRIDVFSVNVLSFLYICMYLSMCCL